LKEIIEKIVLRDTPKAEVEMLFGNLRLISAALAATGALILIASALAKTGSRDKPLGSRESLWIGLVQGLCLPFRGFSRSGATISTGLILGIAKAKAEEFSFALAVVLTPPVILREVHRLLKAQATLGHGNLAHLFYPSLMGMVFSFIAGLLALRWLSDWLEKGKWKYFGVYCLAFALLVYLLS
ncbi:MAG TPA: undecaprenyl-diphosphate phosphatase, partial [bacterium]|nr:undecaprenyl-diphosphate phosphatase [bacterium]